MRAMAETPTPWRCSSRIMTISPSRTNDPSPEEEKGTSSLISTGCLPLRLTQSAHLGNSNRHKWGLFGRHSQPSLHKPEPLAEAGCWIHARRNFFKLAEIARAPEAAEAVGYMLKCWDASTHFPLATAGSA